MKKTKKLLVVIFAALAATSLAACFGANGDQTNTPLGGNQVIEYPKNETVASINLAVTSRNLVIGDTYLLQPNYNKIDGYYLKFSSSNDKVVSVNDLGLVTALNSGSATVKAIYTNGKKAVEASMEISCDFGSYLPEVKLANVNDDVSLFVGKDFKLNPYVTFNGTSFEDGTFGYSIEDTSIATISGKAIKAVKTGETSLIINGEWRGKPVSESIPVKVCDDVAFFNDGNPVEDVVIYTVPQAGGVSYETYIPRKFSVSVNGTTYSSSGDVTVKIANTNVIEAYGTKINSKGFGDTVVTLSTTKGGVTASRSFTVTVKRPEVVINETVPMFATDYGMYLDGATKTRKNILDFASVTDTLVDAYQDGKALTVNEGKVLGVSSSNQAARGTANLVLGTADVLYHFNLETVAKFFTVASDLKELELNSAGARGGYYELLNDIDATGITISHTNAGSASYFNGIFDGKGHNVKNLKVSEKSSIFGSLSSGAVIKNTAFIDLIATEAYYFNHVNGQENGLSFEELYVKVSESTVNPVGMLCYSGSGNVIKNVVIEYTGANADKRPAYTGAYHGSFMAGMSRGADAKLEKIIDPNKNWINVFVVSPFVLGFSPTDGYVLNTSRPSTYHALYVLAANEEKDFYGNDTSGKSLLTRPSGIENLGWLTEDYYIMKINGVYRCDSEVQMIEAIEKGEKDLTTFSSLYWDVTSGLPVWKNK